MLKQPKNSWIKPQPEWFVSMPWRWKLPFLAVLSYFLLFIGSKIMEFQDKPHTKESLQQNYEEVFITPFKNVNVSEYWNSYVGHGIRYRMQLTSTSPLELKNPSSYKEVSFDSPDASDDFYLTQWFAESHPAWMATYLYNKQIDPGPIWVYLSKDKRQAKVQSDKGMYINSSHK